MRVHSVSIRNYRGVRTLDWAVPAGLVCLVGPGNSTKSTILGALDVLFSPRPTVSIADTDFYNCDVGEVLSIEAIVVDLPAQLENFETYGPYVCGVRPDGTITPDPDDETRRGMTVRFTCNESREPLWEVVKPGGGLEPRRLSMAARRGLPFFRVDDRSDQHLRWSRGSSLERLTADTAGAKSALVDAHRQARQAVFDANLDELRATSRDVADGVSAIGGDPIADPRVGLDPGVLASGASLVLHNGQLPFTSYGLGMRRLAGIAVQRLDRGETSLVVMDEIEHGLEPHRLIRLLYVLRGEAGQGAQVVITTHSPVTVESLDAEMLAVVRSADGHTTVQSVPRELAGLSGEPQGTIRSGPSAMLARRVLVVEGATEEGMLRTLIEAWDRPDANLAMGGVVVRSGQSGEQALERAECLARLGFDAAAFIDHDTDLDAKVAGAQGAGVRVFRWTKGNCLESQVAHDIPDDLVLPLLALAAEVRYDDPDIGRRAVLDAVEARLPSGATLSWIDPTACGMDPSDLRSAIGEAAAAKRWFKNNPGGAALGTWLADHLDDLAPAEDEHRGGLLRTLSEVETYLYETVRPPLKADGGN